MVLFPPDNSRLHNYGFVRGYQAYVDGGRCPKEKYFSKHQDYRCEFISLTEVIVYWLRYLYMLYGLIVMRIYRKLDY